MSERRVRSATWEDLERLYGGNSFSIGIPVRPTVEEDEDDSSEEPEDG